MTLCLGTLLPTASYDAYAYENAVLTSAHNHSHARELVIDEQAIDALLGEDNNANGIRDDVETYINKTYKDRPHVKHYALDYAQFMQQQIANINDHEATLKIYENSLVSINCIRDAVANPVLEQHIRGELDKTIFNTDERRAAWVHLKEHISENPNTKVSTYYECKTL